MLRSVQQSARCNSLQDGPKRYENTYKMEPDHHFPVVQVTEIISEVFEEYLRGELYQVDFCHQMCITLSEVIKRRVKELGKIVERFKLVVTVSLGQNIGQGLTIASRSLWNEKTDSYASASLNNGSLFAVGIVFGGYHE